MTIDRTKVKPSFYIEIKGNDISDLILNNGYISMNTKKKISTGSFEVDESVLFEIKKYQMCEYFVEFDNKYKKFGGVVSDVKENKTQGTFNVSVASYAWLTYQTTYSGVFRADAGKGNIKTIMTDILLEKFPNITWDDDSFPDVDSAYDILYKLYNNNVPGDIFDTLSESINRDWWIDNDGVFFCKVRTYTQYNEPVEFNNNIIGLPTIDVNNNYANFVKVFGAFFETTLPYVFSGTGTTDEFDLDFYPAGSITVEYSDGTNITTTMEGNEDYDDPTIYDAYFKISDQKLTFNVDTVSDTDNIIVKTKQYDQIYEEQQSGAEVDRIGYEIVKEIKNDNITTQEEAYQIAVNYLDNYAEDQYIFLTNVEITTDDQLQYWTIGNSVPLNLGDGSSYENIIEETWSWSTSTGLNLQLRFVDFKKTDRDILQELINKIKRQENLISNATTSLTRYFYFGASIVVAFQNASMKYQSTDGRFEMQSVNQDVRSFMSRTATITSGAHIGETAAIMTRGDYTTEQSTHFTTNYDDEFIESFLDDWYIDSDNSTGTKTGNTYVFGAGDVLQSTAVYKYSDNLKLAKITPTIDSGEYKIEISTDGTNWLVIEPNTFYTLSMTDGLFDSGLFDKVLFDQLGTGTELYYRITEVAGSSGVISEIRAKYTR